MMLAILIPLGGNDPGLSPTPPIHYPGHPSGQPILPPWSGNYPSHGLPVYPSTGPVFPGFGGGNYPSQGLPVYPSTGPVFPGFGGGSGNYPSQGLPVYPSTGPVFPGFGPHPGHGLPIAPVYPSHGLPGSGYPSGQPVPPGGPVDPGYGQGGLEGRAWMLVWVPGHGWALAPVGGPPAETKPVEPAEPK